ncbi:MAG: phosphotransferase family protein [Alphaproteobacteria bacterium]|nr:MAG: phosphotransferase family protein [Alphaproteobacteria bacterium]
MSETALQEISDQLVRYLKHVMPEASGFEVSDLARIHGGASRETYRLKLSYAMEGRERVRGLILRRDPVGSLIDTDRRLEFTAYAGFHGSKVPVPAALFIEEDLKWMERPFFIMERIDGCDVASPFQPSPYEAFGPRMGAQFFSILGSIAAQDVEATGLRELVEVPSLETCWDKELSHWEKIIDDDELEPQPIARAAIRYLRRNPPPPAQRLSVVHGDYRTGNFLYDSEGTIKGILDWEMVHLGDPMEDFGWATNPLWAHGTPEKVGGMCSLEEAIRSWEEASGLKFDKQAYDWWLIFNCVKGLGIWISSSKEYADGENHDPVLALAGWICTSAHNKILVELLKDREG